ncbi:MAG: ABC transporter permease [Anaerolineaceae bacterium]|nr:MAG: ABC transporter permease [Anaerolineaceae bacterium]
MSVNAQPAKPQSPPARKINITEIIARYGIVFVLVAMVILMSILSPIIRGEQYFLTVNNLIQVGLQASINAIIAVGMTFIITSGGIDLSVGSIVALCGVVAALAMRDLGIGPVGGFLVAVSVGTMCGLFNGLLITRINLAPFIATLGTMGIFRGLALVTSEGRSIYGFDADFNTFFSYRISLPFGDNVTLPVAVVFALSIALIFWFIMGHTRFGKYTVAIGGNEETARLAGIPVKRYKLGIYALGGFLTGIASVLLLARLRSGDPTFGRLFELDAIAAVVMGGTSLMGGEGTIWGTIVGALIISLVRNAINIFNVPSYWQEVIIGSVIVLAVILDQWRRKQAQKV